MRLKEDIKSKVSQAYSIARNIYDINKNRPIEETKQIIKETLNSFKFNNGRGYFFIYDFEGNNILFPYHPDKEGKNQINLMDGKGNPLIQDFITLLKGKKESFHRWWFYRPNEHDLEIEKIGFLKVFEPFNWIVGTGEYVDDYEQSLQDNLLSWISEIDFGSKGYIFVTNSNGKILTHKSTNFLSDDIRSFSQPLFKKIKTISEGKGGFLEYNFSPYQNESRVISYITSYPEWGWVIGSGVYASHIEKEVEIK